MPNVNTLSFAQLLDEYLNLHWISKDAGGYMTIGETERWTEVRTRMNELTNTQHLE
ncbi:hypothetical protein ACODYM_29085 [Burkholderia gladioli]|uniref:hypothetical protein n=1 Tax=Burkholderia gladioli TaxID=28095 RepID=UPI003B50E568